jgi:hypothetical protein
MKLHILGVSTMGDWRTSPDLPRAFNWNGWGVFKGPDGSTSACYQSYGILQIKVHDFNTWDFARNSTSFNVDFRSAEQRACMNGDFTDYFKSGHGLVTGGYPTYAEAVAGKLAPGWPNHRHVILGLHGFVVLRRLVRQGWIELRSFAQTVAGNAAMAALTSIN